MLKLAEALPEFADELAEGLAAMGYHRLATAVYSLAIAERCACPEPGCVTFHGVPKNSAPDASECHRVVAPAPGVVCLQYSGDQIIWVDVLNRPKDRKKLDMLCPVKPPAADSVTT